MHTQKQAIEKAYTLYQIQINNLTEALAHASSQAKIHAYTQLKVVKYALDQAKTQATNLMPILNMALREAQNEAQNEVFAEAQIEVFAYALKQAELQTEVLANSVRQENTLTYSDVIEQANNVVAQAQAQLYTLIHAFKQVSEYPLELEKAHTLSSALGLTPQDRKGHAFYKHDSVKYLHLYNSTSETCG